MMKICVLSDNHRDAAMMKQIIERESDSELFIHCGDSQMDMDNAEIKRCVCVRGNTDHTPFLQEQLIELEGCKVLVSHGHLYGIDFTTREIVESARLQQATLVLHGHTHIPRDITVDGVRIINPGSTSWPRGTYHFGSYARIETNGDDVLKWNVTFVNTNTWSTVII